MSMPNRDALNPATLDENFADMNSAQPNASAPATAATDENVASESASAATPATTTEAPTAVANRPEPHPQTNLAAAETANRTTVDKTPHLAPIKVVQAPPFPGNDAASTDTEVPSTATVNNESGEN